MRGSLTGATMNANRLAVAALLTAAAAIGGCSKQPTPQPLSPEAFISPRSGTANMPGENGDAAPGTGSGNISPGESVQPNVAVPTNTVAQRINDALGKPLPSPNAAANPAQVNSGSSNKAGASDVVESA